jgi:hypothetical protein
LNVAKNEDLNVTQYGILFTNENLEKVKDPLKNPNKSEYLGPEMSEGSIHNLSNVTLPPLSATEPKMAS